MSDGTLEVVEKAVIGGAGKPPTIPIRQLDELMTAEGGVAKLRKLIYSLAVQGMLSDQRATDEAAAALLAHLGDIRTMNPKGGRNKRPQRAAGYVNIVKNVALPSGWAWASLSDLGTFSSGKTPSTTRPDYWNGSIPWVSSKDMKSPDIFDTTDHVSDRALADGLAIVPVSAVLIVVRSGILRRTVPVAITCVKCTVNQDIKALALLEPSMASYVRLMIMGFEQFILSDLTKIGTTVESIKFDEFASCKFPIPPLLEQKRIVERVDALMELCDALEENGRLADELHERLASTLLSALASSHSAHAISENWRSLDELFDVLFDRPGTVDRLEQAIVQLATRGLLVASDSSEGNGDALLKNYVELASGANKRTRTEMLPLSSEHCPFVIPSNWAWARFGEVTDVSGGVTLGRRGALNEPVTLPYLRVANVQRGHLNLAAEIKAITIDKAELPRFVLKAGDLLITEGGDWDKVGRTCTWRGEIAQCAHQNHVFKARGWSPEWLPAWGELYLNSPDARRYFALAAKQTTNLASINMTELRNCPFPLPPLAEQQRIVDRVHDLRQLCDRLRARLKDTRDAQGILADTLVARAFSADH